MDELLGKLKGYLNDEVSSDDFEAELNKLTPEDKTKFYETIPAETRTALGKKSEELLGKVSALRKEKARIETPPVPPPAPTDFATKMRKENVDKASTRFFTDFKIPADLQAHYLELFKTNDSGHVDADLILNDFKRIYAAENSAELLSIKDKFEGFEQGADEFNAEHGGAPGGSGDGSGGSGKKYSPEVYEWVKESAKQGVKISLEAAERVLNRGLKRTF